MRIGKDRPETPRVRSEDKSVRSKGRRSSVARQSINQTQSEIEKSLNPEERALLNDYELQLAMALSLSLKDQEARDTPSHDA